MRNEELGVRNMKKKAKSKIGLLCSLLFTLCYLFTACDDAGNTLESNTPVGNGYGRISISFTEEEAARTVSPSKVFSKFEYTFTEAGGGSGVVKTPDASGFFTLEVGNYTVAVKAYVNDTDTTPATTGVSEQFTVASGSTGSVRVNLSEIAGTGNGTFIYTITYPAATDVNITLQKWPSGNITLSPGNVTGGNGKTQSLQLASGSYLLTVFASQVIKHTGISEAIHIYPGVSTTYTKAFSADELLDKEPIQLTADTWADDLFNSSDIQWFRFNANASTQYIHVNFGTLTDLYVQVYDASGSLIGSESRLYGSTKSITRSVNSGQVYYIKVRPNSSSGTYQIGFSKDSSTKYLNAIQLTVDNWEDDNLHNSTDEQWFKFTATAAKQYFHVYLISTYAGDKVVAQVYDSNGSKVGGSYTFLKSSTNLNGNSIQFSQVVNIGEEYYLQAIPTFNTSFGGKYKIGFNGFIVPPSTEVTNLSKGVWVDGQFTNHDVYLWFKFKADNISGSQFFEFDSNYQLFFRVFDESGDSVEVGPNDFDVEKRFDFNFSNTARLFSWSVSDGEVYYIRLRCTYIPAPFRFKFY